MMRLSVWSHCLLASYLWLISLVSLGNWNAQPEPHLMSAMLAGNPPGAGDLGFLVFISLPAVLFWIAYWRSSIIFAFAALFFDAFWMLMQIQSWWVPYVAGNAKAWQIEYAKGPRTKLLPSFGTHVAPDGMHFVISVLIVASMATGLAALRRLRQEKSSRSVAVEV
jgi:hypothetical protein